MKKIKQLVIEWLIRELETELTKARVAGLERQITALETRINVLDGANDKSRRIYS